jgi:hypothetical protein
MALLDGASARLALVTLVSLVLFALVPTSGGYQRAEAAVAAGAIRANSGAVANGYAYAEVYYGGMTASTPADATGDTVRFTVRAAAGSSAVPLFENGSTTFEATIGGSPCDANRDSATDVANISKCFARARISSKAPGKIDVMAQNLGAGHAPLVLNGGTSFYQPRAIVSLVAKAGVGLYLQNIGASDAQLVVDLFDAKGSNIPTARGFATVVAGGRALIDLGENPRLESGFQGTAVIGSTEPVVATVRHSRPQGGSQSGTAVWNGSAYPLSLSGSVVSLPYVANRLNGVYNTEFAVLNTGITTACVVITYTFVPGAGAVDAGGKTPVTDSGPASSSEWSAGYPLPATGQLRFAPNEARGITPMPSATINALMAVTVSATKGSATAFAEAYTTDGAAKTAAYEAFFVSGSGPSAPPTDLGTSMAMPLALKTTDGYYTQYLFSNPNPTAADVTIAYSQGAEIYTARITIPANGVGNHSVFADEVVPLGFVGAANVAANVPIGAVLFRAKRVAPAVDIDEDIYTAVNGISSANSATRLAFPAVLRRVNKDDSHAGINSWMSVSVPGGGKATLTIRLVGDCTTTEKKPVYTTTKVISGSFVFYQNADADNGFGDKAPACFSGSAVITSDVPVVGVGSIINDLVDGDGDGVYNAFPLRP